MFENSETCPGAWLWLLSNSKTITRSRIDTKSWTHNSKGRIRIQEVSCLVLKSIFGKNINPYFCPINKFHQNISGNRGWNLSRYITAKMHVEQRNFRLGFKNRDFFFQNCSVRARCISKKFFFWKMATLHRFLLPFLVTMVVSKFF